MEKSHFISMGVKELLQELLVNENVQFGEIDSYNHIKKTTNNFETKCIQFLYVDVIWFIEDICMSFENELFPLSLLSELKEYHQLDLLKFGYSKVIIKLNETINYGEWKSDTLNENKLTAYFELADNLRWYNDGVELTHKLYHLKEYVNMFENILKQQNIDIVELMKDDEWKSKLVRHKKDKVLKQPLTFPGLFKNEYVVKIDMFYSRLIANGYIDKKHIWREAENKNEPAKVYFWLLEKGVLKINKPTPALICFCKEFGITAYKDNELTPAPDIRAVTVKNLLNTTLSKDEKNHFENVFLPFIIK